jgi:hypothetical protein
MTARRHGQVVCAWGAARSRRSLSELGRQEEFTEFVVDAACSASGIC